MRNICSVFILVLCISSCINRVSEKDFFHAEIQTVSAEQHGTLNLDECIISGESIDYSFMCDSLLISMDRGQSEYIFHISDFESDSLIASFCRRGRAGNEMMDCTPIYETYRNDAGDVCADLLAYHTGRLFVWNITQSLQQNKDCYDGIYSMINDTTFLPLLSMYRLDGNRIIAKNTKHVSGRIDSEEAQVYEIYDIRKQTSVTTHDIYRPVSFRTSNRVYLPQEFIGTVECIRPDKKQLAFCMAYMPVYGILDIETGNVNVFKIDGLKKFSPKMRTWNFCDAYADDNYIYALYFGEDIGNGRNVKEKPCTLFVMDWNGNLKLQCQLDKCVSMLKYNSGTLYFTHHSSRLYPIAIEDIHKMVLTNN